MKKFIRMPITASLILSVLFLAVSCTAKRSQARKAQAPTSTKEELRNKIVLLKKELHVLGLRAPSYQFRTAQPWETTGMNEELWIIEKLPDNTYETEAPDTGIGLKAVVKDKNIPLPLMHTDVRAAISARIATVDVRQKYHNPYDTKIEAVYVFPLPQNAAVTDFIMTIGKRHIRGIIREKEEAKKIYKTAKRQGHTASLLTQQRPNIFTQKVANIEPGRKIDIEIRFFNPLVYKNNEYEFVFPTVVGPRFNPPGTTGGIGAMGRGRSGSSEQKTDVEYLKPGTKSGHEIDIHVTIHAGVDIEKVYSPTHSVDITRNSRSCVHADLSPNDKVPNKDFVLRYKPAADQTRAALLTHRGKEENTFSLILQPPSSLKNLPRMAREMIFVIDCSGSMSGWPISKAKEAVRRCLRKLSPADTFQIIRFSDRTSAFGPHPVPATRKNINKALRYVKRLGGHGGTMMINGIKKALDFRHDPERLRIVSFMTDGYIGNEAEIFKAIRGKLGHARIFSFGVGKSVNRYLLEGMARIGRGAVAYVGLGEGAARAVDAFYEQAAYPALTDIRIDWGTMKVRDVYPKKIPDLFAGKPIMLTGHFSGNGHTAIRVTGRTGRGNQSFALNADLDDTSDTHKGLGLIWARWKIADLSDDYAFDPSKRLKRALIGVSLRHSVLCGHTAFVAVDSLNKTSGNYGVSVKQPVPVPEGVRYDTTVDNNNGSKDGSRRIR